MKRFLGSLALAALISGPAIAADIPTPTPYKATPHPVFAWTGCYVGVQGGYGMGRSKFHNTGIFNGKAIPIADVVDDTSWFHVRGGLGGGEIGCNYQTGNWVVGVEVDGSWTALSGRANLIPPFNEDFVAETKERWLTMARGRVGYAYGQWLWYLTGGVARADIDVQLHNGLFPVNTTGVQRVNRVSWVAGFGTEYAITYGWSVKLEALYMDFSTFRAFQVVNPVVCGCDSQDIKLNQWVARLGLNYKW